MRSNRSLLSLGIAIPAFSFAALMAGAAFYPPSSHVTEYASDLGGPDAMRLWIFNSGIVAAVLAGYGFFRALRQLGGSRGPAVLSGIAVSLWRGDDPRRPHPDAG